MTAFEAHHEANRALHRAAELTETEARQHLMVVLLRVSLELRGWCPTCVLNAQADAVGAVQLPPRLDVIDQMHVCTVIPFRKPTNLTSRG